MSVGTLETAIWHATQRVIENPKMRKKDLLEWSTGTIEPREGEIVLHLPEYQVDVAVPAALDKRTGANNAVQH